VAVLDDALAAVACRLQATHPAGDHTLFVGEVLALRVHPHHDRPLAYYAGAFHRIAPHPSIPAPPVSPWGSGFEECWG
jgi:flavin reductase (DIM6/NTAB) family NADH-FMN oxidoreductase RutF